MTDRNDNIKDIWNKHIDVQEQLLRARAVSTPIIPTSIRIVGEKMLMSVDERNQAESMLTEIVNTYSLSKKDLNISDGYFYVDTNISNQVYFSTKQRLSETAEHNYMLIALPTQQFSCNQNAIKPVGTIEEAENLSWQNPRR